MSIIGFDLETIEILSKISVANWLFHAIGSFERNLEFVTLTLILLIPKFFGWTLYLLDLHFEVVHCKFQFQEFE